MINITILGTSCMVPTKERNVSSIYLEYNGEGILFDCGEGTQRQMNIANINRNKVKKIFISHWHGDHVSGILGLIQTISSNYGRDNELKEEQDKRIIEIFGPKETKKRFNHMLEAIYFDNKIDFKIKEIDGEKLTKIYENNDYYIEAISLDHNVPCLGYNFIEKDRLKIKIATIKKLGIPEGPLLGKLQKGLNIEFNGKKYFYNELTEKIKGKKVSIIMDTAYFKNLNILAEESDLIICEATYLEKHYDKGDKHKHMTVRQAAQLANTSRAKKLIMLHFSQRYKENKELEEEARDVFPESYAAYDFMKIKL